MNLSAIQIGKTAAQRTAEDNARRAVSHANSGLAFRNMSPTTEAAVVAKAAASHAPVQPVALATAEPAAPTSDIAAVLKAMTDGFANLAAAVSGPVQKAAPAPASRPASAPVVEHNTPLVSAEKRARTAEITGQVQKAPERATKVLSMSGNAPYVPLETEAQRRRSRDDAAAAQRAAEKATADRVLVSKSGPRVLTFRKLDATLTDAALAALNHIVGAWEGAERRPVRVYATDLSRALDIPLATAQAAFTELVDKRLIISSKNSAGVLLVMPGLGVTGS